MGVNLGYSLAPAWEFSDVWEPIPTPRCCFNCLGYTLSWTFKKVSGKLLYTKVKTSGIWEVASREKSQPWLHIGNTWKFWRTKDAHPLKPRFWRREIGFPKSSRCVFWCAARVWPADWLTVLTMFYPKESRDPGRLKWLGQGQTLVAVRPGTQVWCLFCAYCCLTPAFMFVYCIYWYLLILQVMFLTPGDLF